jgi:outer membrane biosynthesis protein TonB
MKYIKPAHASIAKHTYFVLIATLALLVVGAVPFGYLKAASAGSANYSISSGATSYSHGQTFNVMVNETSVDPVNSLQLNLTYNAAALQFNSITNGSAIGSPFTNCPTTASGGSGSVTDGCAQNTSTSTGAQPVAVISFTILASSGTANIQVAAGSMIVRPSDFANIWNGSASTLTLSATAAPTGGGGTGGGTTGGGTTGGGTTTKPPTPAPTPAPAAKPATTPATPVVATPSPITTTTSTPTPTVEVTPFTIKLVDSAGKPEVGAVVTINGVNETTNASGVASFSTLPAKLYSASILLHGSKTPVVQAVNVVPHMDQQQLTIKLAASHQLISLNPAGYIVIIIIILAIVLGTAIHYFLEHKEKLAGFFGQHGLQPATVGAGGGIVATAIAVPTDTSKAIPGQIVMPAQSVPEPQLEPAVTPAPVPVSAPHASELHAEPTPSPQTIKVIKAAITPCLPDAPHLPVSNIPPESADPTDNTPLPQPPAL